MAVADTSNPKVTQDYTLLLQSIRELFLSQAAMHDGTGIVGLGSGAIRYYGANTRLEKFNGTTWAALSLNIPGTAGNVTGVVAGANGGTGVANTGKTFTMGGNLSTMGAFASIFRMTGVTDVTFPTSGTLISSVGGAMTGALNINTTTANTVPASFRNTNGGNLITLQGAGTNGSKALRVAGGNLEIMNNANNAVLASLSDAGDFVSKSVATTSDERKKENWRPLTDEQLDRVADMTLAGFFDWKDGSGSSLGVSAQELLRIGLTQAVRTSEADGSLSVKYGDLAMALVQAMLRRDKDRHARILERLDSLEAV